MTGTQELTNNKEKTMNHMQSVTSELPTDLFKFSAVTALKLNDVNCFINSIASPVWAF